MSDRFSPPPASGLLGLSRNTVIASGVVLFHVAALWALQSGLIRKAAEVVIPVEILSELIEPPKPKEPPPPPPPPPPQAPQPKVTKAPPTKDKGKPKWAGKSADGAPPAAKKPKLDKDHKPKRKPQV